jgi:branched-chain amino acid transport system ATP-binding protein
VKFDGEDITDLYPANELREDGICRERHPIFQESDLVENLRIAGYLRKRSEVAAA